MPSRAMATKSVRGIEKGDGEGAGQAVEEGVAALAVALEEQIGNSPAVLSVADVTVERKEGYRSDPSSAAKPLPAWVGHSWSG